MHSWQLKQICFRSLAKRLQRPGVVNTCSIWCVVCRNIQFIVCTDMRYVVCRGMF